MAGLIDTGMGATTTKKLNPLDSGSPDLTGATATGYDPSLRTVQSNETVSGQLARILGTDNPLMTQARAGATQTANARGLLNSSMAAGAGESAAIGAALPIAQQDASTYGTASAENTAAENAALGFGANASNTVSSQNAGAANTLTGQGYGAQLETGLIGARTAASKELAAQAGEIQSGLSTQEAGQTQALAQTQGDIQAKLAKINADLNAGLIDTQTAANMRQAAQAGEIQSGLSAQQATQAQSLAQVQGDIQKQLQDLQAKAASGLSAQESAQQKALVQVQGEIQSGLITNQADANARIAQLQGQIQSGLSAQSATQQSGLIAQQGTQDVALQTLRGQQATDLANIEAQYKTLIQTSATAASMYQSTSAAITAILNNPDTSTDQKQAAVEQQKALLQNGLAVAGGMANLDLSNLVTFDTSVPQDPQTISNLEAQIADITSQLTQVQANQTANPYPNLNFGAAM